MLGKCNMLRHASHVLLASASVIALVMVVEANPLPSDTVPDLRRTDATESDATIAFTDARQQTEEFLSHYRSITLTADQERIMDAGLSGIPAPCCKQNSLATCCCPCNLAKSAWGLSKFLIARRNANSADVHAAALRWVHFVNPGGYSGDACSTGGCNRPFAQNGCGGMNDRHLTGG